MMPLQTPSWLSPATAFLTLAIAGLFVIAFYIQVTLLWPYDHLPGISLLFLPHGVRVIAVLIGRGFSIPGLLLGNLLVSMVLFETLGFVELIAVVFSSVMPYLALRLVEAATQRSLTTHFSLTRLLGFVVCSAVLNAMSHTVLFSLTDRFTGLPGADALLTMLAGDIAGGLLFTGVLWVLIKSARDLVIPTALGHTGSPVMTAYALIERTGVVAGGLLLAYQLPLLVDPTVRGTAISLGMAPFLVCLVGVWQYRHSALPGLFLGLLTLAPDYVAGPLAMLEFAAGLVISSLIALWVATRVWSLSSDTLNLGLLRFSLLLLLFLSSFTTLYLGNGHAEEGLGVFWSQIVITGVMMLGCVFWPVLWLVSRIRGVV